MRVLIIDDSELKFKQIQETLDRLISPCITWEKSRNSGLLSVFKHNVQKGFEPFDLVITDNILPIFDSSQDLEPCAAEIVSEIRRMGLADLPIIVCSSNDIKECDCNYKVKYNSSVSMDELFKYILEDIATHKNLKQDSVKKLK